VPHGVGATAWHIDYTTACCYRTSPDALGDPELGLKIREKNPENLNAALSIALQLEVWTKDSYRLQQAEMPRLSENRRNREMTKPGQPLALEKKDKALRKKIAEAKRTIEDMKKTGAEMRKELLETRKKIMEMEERTARPPPVMYAEDTAANILKLPRCFRCGKVEHFIKDCPSFFSGAPPRTYATNNRPGPPPESRPISEKKLTCIVVTYNRRIITALLDTGSDINVAGLSLARKHKWKIHPYDITTVQTASGEDLLVDGISKVPLKIRTQTLDTPVLISPDMSNLIFGIDWMENQGCVFDCVGRKLQVRGKLIPLQREPTSTKVRRIYVSKDVELPPMQQTPVNDRVMSGKFMTRPWTRKLEGRQSEESGQFLFDGVLKSDRIKDKPYV